MCWNIRPRRSPAARGVLWRSAKVASRTRSISMPIERLAHSSEQSDYTVAGPSLGEKLTARIAHHHDVAIECEKGDGTLVVVDTAVD